MCWRSRLWRRAAAEEWDEDAMFALVRRAYPYRNLKREPRSIRFWRCCLRALRRGAGATAHTFIATG